MLRRGLREVGCGGCRPKRTKNYGGLMSRILLLGLDPETVDYSACIAARYDRRQGARRHRSGGEAVH